MSLNWNMISITVTEVPFGYLTICHDVMYSGHVLEALIMFNHAVKTLSVLDYSWLKYNWLILVVY